MTFAVAVSFVAVATIIIIIASYLGTQQNIEKLPEGDELGQMIELQIAVRMKDIYKLLAFLLLFSAPYLNFNKSENFIFWSLGLGTTTDIAERLFRRSLLKKYVPK